MLFCILYSYIVSFNERMSKLQAQVATLNEGAKRGMVTRGNSRVFLDFPIDRPATPAQTSPASPVSPNTNSATTKQP